MAICLFSPWGLMLNAFLNPFPITWLNSPQNLFSESCLHKGIILPRKTYLIPNPLVLFKRKGTCTFKGTKYHMKILSPRELNSQPPTPSYIATYFKPCTQISSWRKQKSVHLLTLSILQQHRPESESKRACPLGTLSSFRMRVEMGLSARVGEMVGALCLTVFLTVITATSFFNDFF